MANEKQRDRIVRMKEASEKLFEEYITRLETPVSTGTDKEKDELQALNLKIAMRKEMDSVSQSIASYEAQLDLLDGKVTIEKPKSKAISPESMAAASTVK